MENISERKQQLRQQMLKKRRSREDFFRQQTPLLIDNIVRKIQKNFAKGTLIASVWPLAEEANLQPLAYQLFEQNYQIALPETPAKGLPLLFRRWHPSVQMMKGRYGTQYPESDLVLPQVILVPLLAFDKAGNRLGYGGGYYDRTLLHFVNAVAIGFAFAEQEISEVPIDRYDRPLSEIITEHGNIIINKRG